MQGYVATTIQQYLSEHPVDEKDVVHVEDGGWINPDGDFGSPQSLQWNYPLMPNNAQVIAMILYTLDENTNYVPMIYRQGSLI